MGFFGVTPICENLGASGKHLGDIVELDTQESRLEYWIHQNHGTVILGPRWRGCSSALRKLCLS